MYRSQILVIIDKNVAINAMQIPQTVDVFQ